MSDKVKTNVIYNDADDKNVSAIVIYVDEDSYACMDEECTRKLNAEELLNAFEKRCLIATSTGYSVPVACAIPVEDSTDYATITYGEATAYSSEYTASPEEGDGNGNGDNLGGDGGLGAG